MVPSIWLLLVRGHRTYSFWYLAVSVSSSDGIGFLALFAGVGSRTFSAAFAAIISVNLAHGARRMAKEKVIVKRLVAMENFGSMNVLCSDKTGTLTEGIVELAGAFDSSGEPSDKVLLYAYLNSIYDTGLASPIDDAISSYEARCQGYAQRDVIPYDFNRNRVSIVVGHDSGNSLFPKEH